MKKVKKNLVVDIVLFVVALIGLLVTGYRGFIVELNAAWIVAYITVPLLVIYIRAKIVKSAQGWGAIRYAYLILLIVMMIVYQMAFTTGKVDLEEDTNIKTESIYNILEEETDAKNHLDEEQWELLKSELNDEKRYDEIFVGLNTLVDIGYILLFSASVANYMILIVFSEVLVRENGYNHTYQLSALNKDEKIKKIVNGGSAWLVLAFCLLNIVIHLFKLDYVERLHQFSNLLLLIIGMTFVITVTAIYPPKWLFSLMERIITTAQLLKVNFEISADKDENFKPFLKIIFIPIIFVVMIFFMEN